MEAKEAIAMLNKSMERKEEEKRVANIKKKEVIAEYKRQIKEYAQRISDILEVAEYMVEHKIPIGKGGELWRWSSIGIGHMPWELNNPLLTDGMRHNVGIYHEKGHILGIGKQGGGWEGANFIVNKEGDIITIIDTDSDIKFQGFCRKADEFIAEFDKFASAFWEYVQNY